jgi:DNA polymerase
MAERLPAGLGVSTVLPDMDFETYSEAGYIWNEAAGNWGAPKGATKKGIFAVGAAVYSEHPTTEVLSLAYDLKDGLGPRLWLPGMPRPLDLLDHIAAGGLIESWNDGFEWWIWKNVCEARMGWPALPFWQLRDAMAKSRAFALPGALGRAAEVLGTVDQKLTDGKRLIQKFSCPRKPSKNKPHWRVRPEDDPADFALFNAYNIGDIKAEAAVSAICPDLSDTEREFWLCTKAMNARGVAIDVATVNAGVDVLDQALAQYNAELCMLTGGTVAAASENQKLRGWLGAHGVQVASLDQDARASLLARDGLPPEARRAVEIVDLIGSAGVKKLYALQRQTTQAGRVHDLFIYHGARTGRDTGADVQPQNLVKSGPAVCRCGDAHCGRYYGQHLIWCPWCGADAAFSDQQDWGAAGATAIEDVAEVIRSRSLDRVEDVYGDVQLALSGCIRGMFVAGESMDLLASDYSSIEAVVAAVLAGEDWRIEAFRQRQDIYLVSAGRITGRTLEEYARHLAETGSKHPDRQKIGKPAELGLGFGGWLNGWRQFDDSDTFTDEQVKDNIKAWRAASPTIVEMWGGQIRGRPWAPDRFELFGLEGAAIAAVQNPGQCFAYRSICYGVKGDALYCRLPSGRYVTYHKPRLAPASRWEGQLEMSFEGWNTNPKNGPMGWIRMQTFAGRLFENVVQAVARDIMAHAVVSLERAGYPLVLRVHDELVSEVPRGFGSVEEFEAIMGQLPAWAAGWPIRAAGGWRGKRYRKG